MTHKELVRLSKSTDPDVLATATALLTGAFILGEDEIVLYDGLSS